MIYNKQYHIGDVVKIVAENDMLFKELSIDFGESLLDSLGVVTGEIDDFDLTISGKHMTGLPGICVQFEVSGIDWYFPNCQPFVHRYLDRA